MFSGISSQNTAPGSQYRVDNLPLNLLDGISTGRTDDSVEDLGEYMVFGWFNESAPAVPSGMTSFLVDVQSSSLVSSILGEILGNLELRSFSNDTENLIDSFTRALYLSGDIPSSMQHIAQSMARSVMAGVTAKWFRGVSFDIGPYIHVRWLWLFPTALLLVITVMTLVLTMIETYRQGTPLWKSIVIPVLAQYLENKVSEEGDRSVNESDEAVKQNMARLGSLEESLVKVLVAILGEFGSQKS